MAIGECDIFAFWRNTFIAQYVGALGFAVAAIILGFIVPGIDNSAHIGGFISGILASIVFSQSLDSKVLPFKTSPFKTSLIAACVMASAIAFLVLNIPAPKYHWREELLIRKQIDDFLQQDQAINRSWLEILHAENQNDATFNGIAEQIDSAIADRYEDSFEKLSQLPANPALPSAAKLESLLKYTEKRKDESRALAEKLRSQQSSTSQAN